MHADQLFPIYRSQPGVQPRHSHARHSNAPHPYAPDRVSKDPRGFQGLLIVLGTRVPSKFAQRVNFENPWGLHRLSCIMHGPPSVLNLRTCKRSNVPTFPRSNLQPTAIDPPIANSKKQRQIKYLPPTYTPCTRLSPIYTGIGCKSAIIESLLY